MGRFSWEASALTANDPAPAADYARLAESEREVCRKLRIDLLQRGADTSPYLIAASGPGGYDNIIMGPTDRGLARGDVLIIDTGTLHDIDTRYVTGYSRLDDKEL